MDSFRAANIAPAANERTLIRSHFTVAPESQRDSIRGDCVPPMPISFAPMPDRHDRCWRPVRQLTPIPMSAVARAVDRRIRQDPADLAHDRPIGGDRRPGRLPK
jgi:hypothetical protein